VPTKEEEDAIDLEKRDSSSIILAVDDVEAADPCGFVSSFINYLCVFASQWE
jgi:hypothetical protein